MKLRVKQLNPEGTPGQVPTISADNSTVEWADGGGGGGGGHIIENDAGTDMTPRGKLQFVGVAVADDAANDRTLVTVSATPLSDDIPTGVYHGQVADSGDSLEASRSNHQHPLAETASGGAADIWYATLAPSPSTRNAGCFAPVGSYIYAYGGSTTTTTPNNTTLDRYDPVLDTWTTMIAATGDRGRRSAYAAANGKVYAFGGLSSSSAVSTQAFRYNPATNLIESLTAISTARQGGRAVQAPSGLIFYGVGWNTGTATTATSNGLFHTYDPVADVHVARATHPNSGRYYPAFSRMADADRLIRTGGYTTTTDTGATDTNIYSISGNSWTSVTAPAAPPVINGSGWGAYYGDQPRAAIGNSQDFYAYDAGLDTWTALTSREWPSRHSGVAVTADGIWEHGGNDVTNAQPLLRRYI